MDAFKQIIETLWIAAKERPKITCFIVTVAFLAFVFYGALSISTDGDLVFAMYVLLAVCAFVVLVILVKQR